MAAIDWRTLLIVAVLSLAYLLLLQILWKKRSGAGRPSLPRIAFPSGAGVHVHYQQKRPPVTMPMGTSGQLFCLALFPAAPEG